MRFLQLGVMFLVFGLFAETLAVAQRPQGFNSNVWHTGVSLLGYNRVRDELKLTDDQMAKIKEIGDEFLEKHIRPFEESAQKLTEEERRQKSADLKKPEREAFDKGKEVLTPEQAARLQQITIWLNGPLAFTEPDVAQELGLTEEQKGALKTIGDEYTNEIAAISKRLSRDFPFPVRPQSTKEERAKRVEEMAKANTQQQEVRSAKEAECLSVLTDDQKSRFEKLRGPKFELSSREPRGP